MFKLVILTISLLLAIASAQVRVTRSFGPDPQCRSNFALGITIATIPNCIPSNCTESDQVGFYEIVECASSLTSVTVPAYWLSISAFGANSTCSAQSRTTIVGARNGQCFPALSGFVSFTCTGGQITNRYCTAACDDENCVETPVDTSCGQSTLLGGIFSNAQCPTEAEPPMAPVSLDIPIGVPSDQPTNPSTNPQNPNVFVPVANGPSSNETSSASSFVVSLGLVAIIAFVL